jgi:hypothetical protein
MYDDPELVAQTITSLARTRSTESVEVHPHESFTSA